MLATQHREALGAAVTSRLQQKSPYVKLTLTALTGFGESAATVERTARLSPETSYGDEPRPCNPATSLTWTLTFRSKITLCRPTIRPRLRRGA